MTEIIKKDETILSEKEQKLLQRTLDKLEQFFPEHKVFAFDAICSKQRENSAKLSKTLGYESVSDFLNAYGFETINGEAVYEIRKECGITPGSEPDFIKERIDNSITTLNNYYPDHVVSVDIRKEHRKLAETLVGFWQWLGYKSMKDMLAAYGFSYDGEDSSKGGRKKTVDPQAIIAELKNRYPEGTTMSANNIKDANPDLKIKSLMNQAKELFGMTLAEYLLKQGIIIGKKKRTAEEDEADKKETYAEFLNEYDDYIQNALLGWKPLPLNADMVIDEAKTNTNFSKIKYNNAIKELNVDEEKHFDELGVLADKDTDNELRELIQFIDFKNIDYVDLLKGEE